MLRSLVICLALAVSGHAALAQEDVITQRQAIYKGFGRVSRDPGQMLQGRAPFELDKVKAALAAFVDGSAKLPALFPDSSNGGPTEALPAIWADKPAFNARMAKFNTDSKTALASITDEASFKAEFPKVLGNCGGCHQAFRGKR